MSSPPRRTGIVLIAAALAVFGGGHAAHGQGATSLTFVRPVAQGPGTPDPLIISDPTIQPLISPGVYVPISMSAVVDLRGQGRPDIIACHGALPPLPIGSGPCRVLRPQVDGSMTDVTRQLFGIGALPSLTMAREIVSGDFNGDGRQDIFVAAYGYDGPPFPGELNVLLISNADGTYTDRSSTLPQTFDSPHSACVDDVNGDGFLDIYVGNINQGPAPYLLLGHGDGTFTQRTTGLPAYIMSGRFHSSLLVDLDRDGYADLVLGGNSGNYGKSIVLFNDGTGDFTTRPQLVLPQGPLPIDNFITLDIASLDFNRDGRPDLMLLSSAEASDNGFGLQVLIGQPDGTFADETAARLSTTASRLTGPWYPFVHFADLNGDGWEDFYLDTILHEDGSIHPRIWLNGGDGTWTPISPAALPFEFNGGEIHAMDVDGDGRPDVVNLLGVPAPDIGYRTFLNRTPSNVLGPELVRNGDFSQALAHWSVFEPPDIVHNDALGGTFEFHRANPTSTASGQATIFSETGLPFAAAQPLAASFDIANTDTVRKRISVLVLDSNFSDLSVCTFWLAPNAPMRTYHIKTHTTRPWTNAAIYFYAASTGTGNYRLDNVSLRADPGGSDARTDCTDPTAPTPSGGPAGANLLTNGDFSAGVSPWGTFFDLVSQVAGGVFQFIRPGTPGLLAGGVLQATNQTMTPGQILTASFQLGNSSAVRKRVTVLLHDLDFSDLSACTFWLSPAQPLQSYAMRSSATKAWTNATLSVYAATTGNEQWTRFDNVSLQRTPGSTVLGTECIEPGAALASLASSSLVVSAGASTSPMTSAGPAMAATALPSSGRQPSVGLQLTADSGLGMDGQAPGWRLQSWLFGHASTVTVQISMDGTNWQTLLDMPPNDDWSVIQVDLRPFAGQVVWLRFVFDAVLPRTPDNLPDAELARKVEIENGRPVTALLLPTQVRPVYSER